MRQSRLAAGRFHSVAEKVSVLTSEPHTPTKARVMPTFLRRNSFSVTNASRSKQSSPTQTKQPNALSASWRCPGQHKSVVSRVCFTSARPIRFRSWLRLLRLCRLTSYPSVLFSQGMSPTSQPASVVARVECRKRLQYCGLTPLRMCGYGGPLFDPFSRIIAEHGGSIGVESQPGQGTTFTVLLPVNAKV